MAAVTRQQIAVVLVLVAGTVLIADALSDRDTSDVDNAQDAAKQYTVSELVLERPIGERIRTTGTVSRIEEDHVSKAGNRYQQFYISDGERELLVFCSTDDGRVNVSNGTPVQVVGKFTEFHGTDEITAPCTAVSVAP